MNSKAFKSGFNIVMLHFIINQRNNESEKCITTNLNEERGQICITHFLVKISYTNEHSV